MTASRATAAIVTASLGGVLLGAAVPVARHLASVSLVAIFVQTLVTVGALAEPGGQAGLRGSVRMLLLHHGLTSLPLMGLGLVLGLDTPLGVGTFLLGAVPPAAGLPSYAAACGVPVRPVLGYCLLAYSVGVLVTPALVLVGVGADDGMARLVLTLVVGLVAPATLATVGARWLRRIGTASGFALVASSITVLTLGLGSSLQRGFGEALQQPGLLLAAIAVAFGRTAVGGGLLAAIAPAGRRRLFTLVGVYKNAALAALLALEASTAVAALPALLSLFSEALVLVVLSRGNRTAPRR